MHQNPRGWRWKRKELKWICHLLQNLTGKEKRERVDWTERWVIDERESSSWGRSSQWFVDHECSDEAEEGLHWLHNSVCVCVLKERWRSERDVRTASAREWEWVWVMNTNQFSFSFEFSIFIFSFFFFFLYTTFYNTFPVLGADWSLYVYMHIYDQATTCFCFLVELFCSSNNWSVLFLTKAFTAVILFTV